MPMNRAPSPAAVHWRICRSPSELPNASTGRRPMNFWMFTGLARAVVDEVDLRLAKERRLAVLAELVRGHEARAHDLLGRDPVDALGPRAHELDRAARHDVGLEAVRAQMREQLEHRLEHELGVRALETGML